MHKKAALALGLLLAVSPVIASADQLTDLIAQVNALMAQLKTLQTSAPSTPTIPTTSVGVSGETCISLTQNMGPDDTDADASGEVTKLQTWLASQPGTYNGTSIYPEARITGYFGPATMRAVQRWQAKHNIVASGDPDSTGYGYIGPKTRTAMNSCAGSTGTIYTQPTYVPPSNTSTQVGDSGPTINSFFANQTSITAGQAVTLSWSSNAANCGIWGVDGSNIKAGAGSASTFTVTPNQTTTYNLRCYSAAALASQNFSSYATRSVTVTVQSEARGTIDASTLAAGPTTRTITGAAYGTDQVILWISGVPLGTIPVTNGRWSIVVGDRFEFGSHPVQLKLSDRDQVLATGTLVIDRSAPTPAGASITFNSIFTGNPIDYPSGVVYATYAYLPSNSQIRLVNATTGARYDAQSTMVWGGGSGQLSITIPNDLPNGTYYLRVTDYYNPNTTIAQSGSFQAGKNMQSGTVTIYSFTASPGSVNAGGAVMFMWSSSLSQNDISAYGGGCNIEGLANNTALYVTKAGFTGASGQITFVPPATGTYTLRCYSGAKDGSPSASRQVTVNVAQPQTNPVVISAFTASQTSVQSGQPVTFSWNSNLTSNDVSYYGGACNIEGRASGDNTALYVSAGSGSYGASGSITYTPAFTASYTLRCYAGAKDGSPMDTKQVTVSVN